MFTDKDAGYEPDMIYLPLAQATAQMSACEGCFFDDHGVTPCPEHTP